jgi:DNA-binding MarR family transcriptional regulator
MPLRRMRFNVWTLQSNVVYTIIVQRVVKPELDKIGRGCLAFQMRSMSRTISAIYDAALSDAGLKTTQFSVLVAVANRGSVKPGELARSLRMDESTLSRNVERMCARGWLRVEPGSDRRSRRISITANGIDLIRAAYPAWCRVQDEIANRVGSDGVAALKTLARRLRHPASNE